MGPFFQFSICAHHQLIALNERGLLDHTLYLAAFLEVHTKEHCHSEKRSLRKPHLATCMQTQLLLYSLALIHLLFPCLLFQARARRG